MKLVVLTNKGSIFGLKLLNELSQSNISVEAIIVLEQSFRYYMRLFNYVKKRAGLWQAVFFSLRMFRSSPSNTVPVEWGDKPFISEYNSLAKSVFFSHGTNSDDTLAILGKIAPDVMLLGQTGIVRKKVLAIPEVGTLNAHPGILPFYRGIDCAKWAIFNDETDKIGATVHLVDEGVDTGPIIKTSVYDFKASQSLEMLENDLDNLSVKLMAEVVNKIIVNRSLNAAKQEIDKGRQYYKMPLQYEKKVKKKMLML
jgi:folate-dependent phosphoribosylglycinamide formyltransferase PurN